MANNIIRINDKFTAVRKHFLPLAQHLVVDEVVKQNKTFCLLKNEDLDKIVELDYSFPVNPLSGIKPYLHQKITTEFIVNNPRCAVLSAQGCGKSLSSLHAVDYLIATGQINNCLYVGPLSVLIDPITREIKTHLPHITYTVLAGSTKAAKQRKLADNPKLSIINHDGLTAMLRAGTLPSYDMIIYDEASALKNGQALRYKLFFKYLAVFGKHSRLVIMTGTPMAERITDAFTLIKLINPEALVKANIRSYSWFRESLMFRNGPFKWRARDGAEDVVFNMLQPSIRFSLSDSIDLPTHSFFYQRVELSKEQSKLLKELQRDSEATLGDTTISVANAAVLQNKLLQILCGTIITDDGVRHVESSGRYDALKSLVEESETPVVVFTTFKATQAHLKQQLEKDLDIEVAVISGEVSSADRGEIFTDFEKGRYKVLLAHPRTVSHGVDLTASNIIVYYSAIYSSELYLQGIDRIRRLSSLKRGFDKFLIYHLYANSLEKEIYEALKDKRMSQDLLFKLIRGEL